MGTTAAIVAKTLANAGIRRVFGLPGGEVLVLIDELRQAGIDFVLLRHEANAGIAAAVYGKLQRQPGVVLVTLGPGAANLMLPLSNAMLDQEPLLAISAQIPDDFPASHTHQLLPLHDVYRPISRLAEKITAQNAGGVVSKALSACMTRPYGTAYLTLSTREAVKAATNGASPPPPLPSGRGDRGEGARAAKELTGVLAKAKRPLVVVGLSTDPANADRLRRWLDTWGLPVAVTPKIKGIVDETAGNFVGTVGGMAADDLMCEALQSADLLIGFGLDPVEIDKQWHAELPIHWLLETPNVYGIIPDGVELVSHAALLDALQAEKAPARWDRPFREFQQRRRGLLANPAVPLSRQGEGTGVRVGEATGVRVGEGTGVSAMWPGDLVNALAGVAPPETIVTTDVGSHKYLFGQFWPSRNPETFWMSNGLSGMAYGLSAALGAKLARPEAPVLAAVGDGGFSMNCQELETAERVGAPFVTVVLADHSYSLIKLSQENKKLEPYRMDFGPIDSVKIAEACGVQGLRTVDPAAMANAVGAAFRGNRSLVVEVPVDYRDYKKLF